MNPFTPIPAGIPRLIAYAIAAVLALILLIAVLSGMGVSWDPFGWGRNEAARDNAGAITGEHGKKASDEAQKAASDLADRTADREKTGRDSHADITGQKDAGADAGDTGRAQLRRLCDIAPTDSRCAGLQRPSPARP